MKGFLGHWVILFLADLFYHKAYYLYERTQWDWLVFDKEMHDSEIQTGGPESAKPVLIAISKSNLLQGSRVHLFSLRLCMSTFSFLFKMKAY